MQLHQDCLTTLSALGAAHKKQPFHQIALVLGDQLNASHSWWRQVDPERLVVMFELPQEMTYVKHHRQKILAFFAAMRSFANALVKSGHRVLYLPLNATDQEATLTATLERIMHAIECFRLQLQEPDEYRLEQQLEQWQAQQTEFSVEWHDSEHFLTSRTVLADWFPGKDKFVMESFYRRVRKQTGYLMTAAGQPIGDKWNFDKSNRNKLPKQIDIPAPLLFANDVSELNQLLDQAQIECLGTVVPSSLLWPINRTQARELLSYFLTHLLPNFGRYQDALTDRDWSLYHSRLSFALNSKILSPKEVVEKAIAHWQQHQDTINLAQIEGFVRQIIGWREFVRAIYWQKMPAYANTNFFQLQKPLPDFYWTGQTKMKCVSHSVTQSLEYAYAHHIQRLMVTGNFALLAGVHPDAVDEWYLGIYIDAIEWVELPNTRGMSQFADGGQLATKPYVSSGAYIDKMSDYCAQCHYQVKLKVGDKACPFNSLYWNFIEQHWDLLKDNHRMAMITRQWEQRAPEDKQALLAQAQHYLEKINQL